MILFFALGLGIIGLGIFALIHSKRMYKLGKVSATVQNCVERYMQIGDENVTYYEVTLEVPTAFGVTYVTMKDNQSYSIGDIIQVFYDESRGRVELPKNIVTENSKGPYLIIGFGVLICALLLWSADFTSSKREKPSYPSKETVQNGKITLNEKGYSNEYIEMPDNEKYSEYFYTPNTESEDYAYNIKIYHNGVGMVTLFPSKTTGKAFNQFFAFYINEEKLKEVVEDSEKYKFSDFINEKSTEKITYYIYYYDGKEREGSGGYIIPSTLYKKVVEHIEGCVPKNVWDAIDNEMEKYYK